MQKQFFRASKQGKDKENRLRFKEGSKGESTKTLPSPTMVGRALVLISVHYGSINEPRLKYANY